MAALPNIALAQINATVGDIPGNTKKILAAYEQAKTQGAELVVFPELAVTGYPPEDLILMPEFRRAAMDAAENIAGKTADGPAMVVGNVWEEYNAALLLDGGKIAHVQKKTLLPNYGIFDEKRVFKPGGDAKIVAWRGHKLGLLVCEDIWDGGPAAALCGADVLIVVNASPFEAGKRAQRHAAAAHAASRAGAPLVYVNLVGGQDDIVFDGGSFVMSREGKITAELPEFEEAVVLTSSSLRGRVREGALSVAPPSKPPPSRGEEQRLWRAMGLGLRDYVEKNGFPGVLLGISGGIDSALTAACAVDALGPKRVTGVLLSSPYTSKESVEDAEALAKNLGIETLSVPITPSMQIAEEVLSPVFHASGWMEKVSIGGNLQARLRGLMLMALSNHSGRMLLSTGNKSEIAVGYTTLYGDSCGGYNVVKDLYKTQIYALAKWRNGVGAVIPARSITKPPSAELAPGQKDEDQLPPYTLLDRILECHIERRMGAAEIAAEGYDEALVEKIVAMVRRAEYKRRQSCPGVKLSSMMFGRDRRFPLTNGFSDA